MKQDKIWDAFQNDGSLLNHGFPARSRLEFIAKHIPNESTVLNIGVGSGYLEEILVQKGAMVSCLDPSDTAIEKIRQKFQFGERAKVGYSQAMPFPDDSFDYLIMSEVLEHLDDVVLEETLKEGKRVLKKGGRFIGTVPADENLNEGIVVCPKCGEYFHRWGHVQSFSQERLHKNLSLEFRNVYVKRVVLSDFKQLNWKGKISAVLTKIQALLNKKGRTQNLFFIARE